MRVNLVMIAALAAIAVAGCSGGSNSSPARTPVATPAPPDTDGDGVIDDNDNCQAVANAPQSDDDADNVGNVCDTDLDNDGVANDTDNCTLVANPEVEIMLDDGSIIMVQIDTDQDGYGNQCDGDFDNDARVTVSLDRVALETARDAQSTDGTYDELFDLNVDGVIDGADLIVWDALVDNMPGPSENGFNVQTAAAETFDADAAGFILGGEVQWNAGNSTFPGGSLRLDSECGGPGGQRTVTMSSAMFDSIDWQYVADHEGFEEADWGVRTPTLGPGQGPISPWRMAVTEPGLTEVASAGLVHTKRPGRELLQGSFPDELAMVEPVGVTGPNDAYVTTTVMFADFLRGDPANGEAPAADFWARYGSGNGAYTIRLSHYDSCDGQLVRLGRVAIKYIERNPPPDPTP